MEFIDSPENKEELWPLVVKECELIKNNFSKEEIDKLELDIIDPTTSTACIYGIMVGDCNNIRVHKFILSNLNVLIKQINFGNKVIDWARASYYMTPLEEYIHPTRKEENCDELKETVKERIQKVIDLLQN